MVVEYFLGLDLGQSRDHTALAVLERRSGRPTWMDWRKWQQVEGALETSYDLQYVERVRLRTRYPEVVARVRDVLGQLPAGTRHTLVVDATGVGAPVADYLRDQDLGQCVVAPVVITGSGEATSASGVWRVPKCDLVGVCCA